MKKIVYVEDVTGVEGQKRLDHYNEWLRNPSRPFTSIYPGYPDDIAPVPVAVTEVDPIIDTPKENTMSKLNVAIELVKSNQDKKAALDAIVQELGVTRANAFVYWSKAQKTLVGDAYPNLKAPKTEKVVKTKTVGTRKTNPVTGTTPAKAAAKIKEIDAVIAGLKASGASVASPFPVAA